MRTLFFIRLLFIVYLSILSYGVLAQTPSIRWESGVSFNKKFNQKWSLNTQLYSRQTFNEYQSNKVDVFTDRIDIRPFLTYSFFKQRKLSLGYMYRRIEPLEFIGNTEHRITQQFVFISKTKALRIVNRIRLEERIFNEEFFLRFRYRLSYDKPLQGQTIDPGEFYGLLANELLYSSNFDNDDLQNRFSIGIGKVFKNKQKLQFKLLHFYSDLLTETRIQIVQFETVYFFSL